MDRGIKMSLPLLNYPVSQVTMSTTGRSGKNDIHVEEQVIHVHVEPMNKPMNKRHTGGEEFQRQIITVSSRRCLFGNVSFDLGLAGAAA